MITLPGVIPATLRISYGPKAQRLNTGDNRMRSWGPIALVLLLTACGTRHVDLPYAAQRPLATEPYPNGVSLAVVEDARSNAGSQTLGEIRTSLGFRQGELDTNAPVEAIVGHAVVQGLGARGMLPEPGQTVRYDLAVRVLDLSANRYGALEATADLLFVLTERETGQQVWLDRARVHDIDASQVSLDLGLAIIAPARSLALLTRRTLSLAIDQALDRPSFRAMLHRTPQPQA